MLTRRYAHLERTVADSALAHTVNKQEHAAGISFVTLDKAALPPPKRQRPHPAAGLAGAEGLEPAAFGFGDRGSEERGTAAGKDLKRDETITGAKLGEK